LATLSSLNNARDEEDDDEDEDYSDEDEASKPRDLFAGGEKSGLAVQDPAQQASSSSKKLIQDIIQQAKS
jgi:UBX domain-containing protein 1